MTRESNDIFEGLLAAVAIMVVIILATGEWT